MSSTTDPTLSNILNQAKAIKKNLEQVIKNSDQRILDINRMASEIDDIIDVEVTISNQTLLRQYKSSLYQMKSEIDMEIQDLTAYLKKINTIIGVIERAIKLSTGDIF